MQVRTSGAPRHTNSGDLLTAFNALTGLYHVLSVVPVATDDAVAMGDHDKIAKAGFLASENNNSVSWGAYRGADGRSDIKA